jgi:hypothetical protein
MLNELDLQPSRPSGAGAQPSHVDQFVDLYPPELRRRIDETNGWVYPQVNNGVYRAGFATRQAAYASAEADVHDGLRRCDETLRSSRFLCGETLSEADVRLLPTAARFDGVYASFFRCGRRQIRSDYPHVRRWATCEHPVKPNPPHVGAEVGAGCSGRCLRSGGGCVRASPAVRCTWDSAMSAPSRPSSQHPTEATDTPYATPRPPRWLGEMLELTGGGWFDLDAARASYYRNLFPLNPGGIVPAGPTAADLGFPPDAEPRTDASAFTFR